MLTQTSLKHPRTQRAIACAAFEAASHATEKQFGKAYVARADGNNILRVDFRLTEGEHGSLMVWGPESRIFIGKVSRSMGLSKFLYIHRLCDALASPATEKVW